MPSESNITQHVMVTSFHLPERVLFDPDRQPPATDAAMDAAHAVGDDDAER